MIRGGYRDKEIQLWRTLDEIREALALSIGEFSDELGLSTNAFSSLQARRKSPPAPSMIRFADRMNVSSDLLFSGTLDLNALVRTYRGEKDVVPERYTHTAYARRRGVMPLFLGTERYIDPSASTYLHRRLQVSQTFLSDLDRPINLNCLVDTCNILAERYGCDAEAFRHMGQMSTKGNRGGRLDRILSRIESPMELYECVFADLIQLFDENWDYSIENLNMDSITIKVLPKEKIVEGFKTKTPGSSLLCEMKGGVGSSFSEFRRLPYSTVNHTKCIHRGDRECLYQFDYSLARSLSDKPQAALIDFPNV